MCVSLQEKLSQAKEDELQASLADTAKQLEEARAAAQEQARRLADEERQLARLQHEADMKVTCICLRLDRGRWSRPKLLAGVRTLWWLVCLQNTTGLRLGDWNPLHCW